MPYIYILRVKKHIHVELRIINFSENFKETILV